MALSNELISQFAKIAAGNNSTKQKSDQTVYGTVVEYNGSKYMKIDGSDLLTPMRSTTNVEVGERVVGTIKNHSLLVTGNMTSPSARTTEVEAVGSRVSEFETVMAHRVTAQELEACYATIENLRAILASVENLEAINAYIANLEARFANIETLSAVQANVINAEIETLLAKIAEIENLSVTTLQAATAEINNLQANIGSFNYVSAEKLNAMNAEIQNADIKYANIEFSNITQAAMEYFYSQSGLIQNVTVGEQTITGQLVGVTIVGDLIEAGTLKADKLVIKGEDGLYYKLNTDGVTIEAEQTNANSLNGSLIQAQSITANKISVTDLVAFDATIGGFKISDNSIYSGVKESVDNTTRGIYMDSTGQISFGDETNYVKFYKDEDGKYRLAISASTISFGGGSSLEESVNQQVAASVQAANLIGQNLLTGTSYEWTYKSIDIGTVFHISTEDLVREYGLSDGDNLVYSVELRSSGSKKLAAGWILTNGTYNIADFNKSSVVSAGSESRVVIDNILFNSSYKYLALAILNVDYQTTSSKLFVANVADGGASHDITEAYRYMQLEKGSSVTEWSYSPIDWQNRIANTEETASNAQTSANNAQSSANSALLEISSINAMIQNLVTGQNGQTLMTQTSNGWTFNFASIQDTLAALNSNVSNLNGASEDTRNQINSLISSINDLGQYTEYITFGVRDGQPCITLGESDSPFKVVITNTGIQFMEGTAVPAKISNQSLHIEKAVIQDELTQGNFTWMARSNGHYSLLRKG